MLTDSPFYIELNAENYFPLSIVDFEIFEKIYKKNIFFLFTETFNTKYLWNQKCKSQKRYGFVKYTFSATTYHQISEIDLPKFFEKNSRFGLVEKIPRHLPVDFVKNRNLSDRNQNMLTDSPFYVELIAENRFPISLTDFELFEKIYKIKYFTTKPNQNTKYLWNKRCKSEKRYGFVKYTFSATTYHQIREIDFPKFFEKVPRNPPVKFVKNRNLSDRN